MKTAFSAPLIVRPNDSSAPLERVPLSGSESSATYKEDWLQKLLYRHPEMLPVQELDDAFAGMIPICREMGLPPAGDADIVYVTKSGRPVVVEAKLWRNPEARRKVLAQVLDYAKELSKLDFEGFDKAVRAARQKMDGEDPPRGLIEIVKGSVPDLDEATFCDSIVRNLKRGDMLLMIAGDGIREGVGSITDFLEGHASLHFTFGLVEIAIFRMPEGGLLVQPRVLAQSTIVRRLVVELRDGQMSTREEDMTEVNAEAEISPEVIADRARFERFWSGFLSKLRLDDQSQPIRGPARSHNQYFPMPKGSDAWVSAYVAPSVHRAGAYLTFSKGPIGDRLYTAMKDDKDEIERALGVPVEWESDGQKHWIVTGRTYDGRLIEDHADELQAVMADHVNRYVNVFRPRLERQVRERA